VQVPSANAPPRRPCIAVPLGVQRGPFPVTMALMHKRVKLIAWAALTPLAGLLGCGGSGTQTVGPQSFYQPGEAAVSPAGTGTVDSPNARSGQLPPPETNVPTVGQVAQPLPEMAQPAVNPDAPERPVVLNDGNPPAISEAVRQSVASTTQPVEAVLPDLSPSTQPAGLTLNSSAQDPSYFVMGGLVAEVNGVPIYASKILHLNALSFQKEARDLDFNRFRQRVKMVVDGTIDEQIHTELLVAVAKRTLANDDLKLADMLTYMWRQRQITDAGGSEELARRRAEAGGQTFAEQAEDQHKQILVGLHEERMMKNQVVITVDDMRQYYRDHVEQFTAKSSASFYLLQVDPKDLAQPGDSREASRQRALDRIKDYHERVAKGEDFAGMCQQDNLLPVYKQQLNMAHLRMKDVDAEMWRLPIGKISDPIEDGGLFYLVRVDSRTDGSVASFDDAKVQEKIHLVLEVAQLNKLKEAEIAKLEKNAVLKHDATMVQTCIDMVMENYPLWHNAKAPVP